MLNECFDGNKILVTYLLTYYMRFVQIADVVCGGIINLKYNNILCYSPISMFCLI